MDPASAHLSSLAAVDLQDACHLGPHVNPSRVLFGALLISLAGAVKQTCPVFVEKN